MADDIGNLTEHQRIMQFDAVMLSMFHITIQRIHKEELLGRAYSLQMRWNVIAQEISIAQKLGVIRDTFERTRELSPDIRSPVSHVGKGHGSFSHRSDSMGSTSRNKSIECFNCKKTGHMARDCPEMRQRGFIPRSRSGSRGSRSGSSNRSNSSRGSHKLKGEGKGNRGRTFSGRAHTPNRSHGGRGKPRYDRSRSRSLSSRSSSSRRSGYRSAGSGKGGKFRKSSRDFHGKGGTERTKLLARQRSGRCLTCGGSGHRTDDFRRGRSPRRTPTPRRSGRASYSPGRRRTSSHRVNFRVSSLDGAESSHGDAVPFHERHWDPPASGREGDVREEDEAAVDAYMAARSIDPFVHDEYNYDEDYYDTYASQSEYE